MKTMRKKTTYFLGLVLMLVVAMSLASCHKKLGPTKVAIKDSIRHYPPVILGDKLDMVYVVKNMGKEMLIITDIQPSCLTIESEDNNITTIPPGEEALLRFTFHADKNIGLARHSIRVFGNIAPRGVAEIIFETNVVRPSVDLSDYEEYYQKNLRSPEEHLLDGRYSEQGYY